MTENDQTIEFLTRTGDLLCGRDWIVQLGREMEISSDMIFNWISRKAPLTMSDELWVNVFYVLGQRGNPNNISGTRCFVFIVCRIVLVGCANFEQL